MVEAWAYIRGCSWMKLFAFVQLVTIIFLLRKHRHWSYQKGKTGEFSVLEANPSEGREREAITDRFHAPLVSTREDGRMNRYRKKEVQDGGRTDSERGVGKDGDLDAHAPGEVTKNQSTDSNQTTVAHPQYPTTSQRQKSALNPSPNKARKPIPNSSAKHNNTAETTSQRQKPLPIPTPSKLTKTVVRPHAKQHNNTATTGQRQTTGQRRTTGQRQKPVPIPTPNNISKPVANPSAKQHNSTAATRSQRQKRVEHIPTPSNRSKPSAKPNAKQHSKEATITSQRQEPVPIPTPSNHSKPVANPSAKQHNHTPATTSQRQEPVPIPTPRNRSKPVANPSARQHNHTAATTSQRQKQLPNPTPSNLDKSVTNPSAKQHNNTAAASKSKHQKPVPNPTPSKLSKPVANPSAKQHNNTAASTSQRQEPVPNPTSSNHSKPLAKPSAKQQNKTAASIDQRRKPVVPNPTVSTGSKPVANPSAKQHNKTSAYPSSKRSAPNPSANEYNGTDGAENDKASRRSGINRSSTLHVGVGSLFSYMYSPFIETLVAGAQSIGISPKVHRIGTEVSFHLGQLREAGEVEYARKYGLKSAIEDPNSPLYFLNQMKRGNVLVWVGVLAKYGEVPWKILQKRGVYTAKYQLEPATRSPRSVCTEDVGLREADEMWDYSMSNIRHLKAHCPPKSANFRHIPAGYQYNSPKVEQKPHEPQQIIKLNQTGKAYFLGNLRFGDRWKCYSQIRKSSPRGIGRMIGRQDGLFSRLKFSTFLLHPLTTGIFYNMHQDCLLKNNVSYAAEPRLSQLLSAKGLVISQKCDPTDEEKYRGLVDFVPLSDIGNRIKELTSLSLQQRQALADSRFKIFKKRFDPYKIFQDAGLFHLFKIGKHKRDSSPPALLYLDQGPC